jgi:DUF971 family protein
VEALRSSLSHRGRAEALVTWQDYPGHGTNLLQKCDVGIKEVEAVGHYAIRPTFSDGHDTGIYSWDYLYDLGQRQDELWRSYLERLAAAGASREPNKA